LHYEAANLAKKEAHEEDAMFTNTLKQKLRAGQLAIGCLVAVPAPHLVEICGLLGFDYVFIDAEHGVLTPGECEGLVRAAELRGVTPLVRVPQNDPAVILRYLDTGAHGVIVPAIHDQHDAQRAVAAARYYPQGGRGLAMVRAADFGLGAGLAEYTEQANQELLVIAVVESRLAVENIHEVAATPGIDAMMIGPVDLSMSYGLTAQIGHPTVQEAIRTLMRGGQEAGLPVSILLLPGQDPTPYLQQGCKFFLTTCDALLAHAAQGFLASLQAAAKDTELGVVGRD
jgi:4-hydroxy-2-oxoheptanedioate aldolase